MDLPPRNLGASPSQVELSAVFNELISTRAQIPEEHRVEQLHLINI